MKIVVYSQLDEVANVLRCRRHRCLFVLPINANIYEQLYLISMATPCLENVSGVFFFFFFFGVYPPETTSTQMKRQSTLESLWVID